MSYQLARSATRTLPGKPVGPTDTKSLWPGGAPPGPGTRSPGSPRSPPMPLPPALTFRLRLVGFSAALSLFVFTLRGGSVGSGPEGLRQALADQTGREVDQIVWEPARSWPSELLFGRPLLFLGNRTGEPTELMRAFVRLSPEGKPLHVGAVRNLSQTDLAAEDDLVGDERIAVVRSRDEAGPHTLTVLGLAGDVPAAAGGLLGRIQLAISRFLEDGSLSGLARSHLVLPEGTRSVHLKRQEEALIIELDQHKRSIPLEQLFNPEAVLEVAPGIQIEPRRGAPLPWIHWSADVGRRLFGPGAIAWLEGRFFSAKDALSRARYAVTHDTENVGAPPTPRPLPPPERADAAPRLPFPPAPIASPWPRAQPDEGTWQVAGRDFFREAKNFDAEVEAPLFYQTFIRPDPERPYARHHLVVMDMTRLELGIRAGYEDPRPRTGSPGSGHVPREPEVFRRIVATFNGAFKVTHGAYGMRAEGRTLIPPVPGAATVLVDPRGRVGIGTYRPEEGANEQLVASAIELRQNLDPLLSGGELLPTGRTNWGDHIYGSGVASERSGLCVTSSGHLVYAWSEEATARSLARAMQMAGCTAGMHLDMNPGHCAFTFNDVSSFDPLVARGAVLHPGMQVNATRYIRWSPKDFFYVARRSETPTGPGAAEYNWEALDWGKKEGTAALARGRRAIAQLELEVLRLDLSRVDLGAAPGDEDGGSAEPDPSADGFWMLGHATPGSRPGLSVANTWFRPFDRSFASLVLETSQEPRLLPPGAPIEAGAGRAVIQLPLLARDGELTAAARRLTGRRLHGALCLDERGHLYSGSVTHDSPAPVVLALLELGCRDIVEMDRGSHSPAVVQLEPLTGPSAGTALTATVRPARAHAYEF